MTDLVPLSKESVKGLGAGAYLVNVLPSTVLVLTVFALFASRLYPWSDPVVVDGRPVAAGPESVVIVAGQLGVAGGIVVALVVVVGAVLLRPFQIGTVQLLEGYWRWGGLVKALAIERHIRRASASVARRYVGLQRPVDPGFASVAEFARIAHRARLIEERAEEVARGYPVRAEWIMPTTLGNVLRRAETTAGERYGLDTIHSYPRLYPYLSERLDSEAKEQLNGIDVGATFVVIFSAQTLLAMPLLWRLDWWSVIPVLLAVLAVLAYRGARSAAGRYGQLLGAAFDLHRFDMMSSMHLPLPLDGEGEYQANLKLSNLLRADRPWEQEQRQAWKYAHPDPVAQPPWGLTQRAAAGSLAVGSATAGADEGKALDVADGSSVENPDKDKQVGNSGASATE